MSTYTKYKDISGGILSFNQWNRTSSLMNAEFGVNWFTASVTIKGVIIVRVTR